MNVYDNDVILDWTPREYQAKMKGAQHRIIDEYEMLAKSAMANAFAQNGKSPKEKKIFNAKKARKLLDADGKTEGPSAEAKKAIELTKAFRGFVPDFKPKPKGGA